MAEAAGTAVEARPGAPYFPRDPTEPHWRWHAARVGDVLDRVRDAQVRQWLVPMLDTFRLRYVAVNERLDAGEAPTVTDHDWRAFFDLQEKIERHCRLDGNPVDGAVNHLLRRFGQVPVFGLVDPQLWRDRLTPAEIRDGVRPAERPRNPEHPDVLRDIAERTRKMSDAEFDAWVRALPENNRVGSREMSAWEGLLVVGFLVLTTFVALTVSILLMSR